MDAAEPPLSHGAETPAGNWQLPGSPGQEGRVLERDERKNATILFADIVGSTAMVATRDPEVALDILRPALSQLSEAVQRYGGTVNRVTGDGVMAMFGAPFTDEEHALGACCAALEMHAALARSGFEIPLRVGIHSGEIVVHQLRIGGVQTLDAAGEAVHLAARLQQDAPSGSTWISDATFALARGRVETRIVGPQPFRGFAVPVVVHLLQAADASLSRLDVAGTARPVAVRRSAGRAECAGGGVCTGGGGERMRRRARRRPWGWQITADPGVRGSAQRRPGIGGEVYPVAR